MLAVHLLALLRSCPIIHVIFRKETAMAPISHEYITDFGSHALEQFSKKTRNFASLSEKYASRITSGIYAECTVHLLALATTTENLVGELQLWANSHRETDHELSNTIAQTSWDLAVQSLQNCVRIAEVDRSKQLIDLAQVIAEKAASLAGLEAVKLLFDAANALRDSGHVWRILDADQVTTGQILLELDLFAMSALAGSQYAVAQVHALTQPRNLLDPISISLEASGRTAMNEAKQFVVERVRDARRNILEAGAKLWIRFPEEGLWADAPPF